MLSCGRQRDEAESGNPCTLDSGHDLGDMAIFDFLISVDFQDELFVSALRLQLGFELGLAEHGRVEVKITLLRNANAGGPDLGQTGAGAGFGKFDRDGIHQQWCRDDKYREEDKHDVDQWGDVDVAHHGAVVIAGKDSHGYFPFSPVLIKKCRNVEAKLSMSATESLTLRR